MKRLNKAHPRLGWFLLFAILATAVIIFLFSCQDGIQSGKTSSRVIQFILNIFYPEYDSLNAAQDGALYRVCDTGLFHLFVFAVQGLQEIAFVADCVAAGHAIRGHGRNASIHNGHAHRLDTRCMYRQLGRSVRRDSCAINRCASSKAICAAAQAVT